MRALILVIAMVLFAPCHARAQTDFTDTTLATGQLVRVTDASGAVVQGPVIEVTPSSLRVGGFVFQPQGDLKVERLGDKIWDGAAIGFAVGALLGGATPRTGCFSDKSVACLVLPALEFGAIAAFIDYKIVGRRTVFLGQTPAGKGLALRFSF